MSGGAWLLLHALWAVPQLQVEPLVQQSAVLVLADDVTAGGAGGGLGVQLVWREHWIAQADVGLLVLFGNAVLGRLAVGVQAHDAHATWSPAAWLTFGTIWGDRIEALASDGARPAWPSWALGVRGAALRFRGPLGSVSLLEPGIASNWSGDLWLELNLMQLSAHF